VSVAAAPGTLPRLLTGLPANGAMTLAGHYDIHGALPPLARRRRDSGLALINELERSGLRGRGGAAFPAATKLAAVASARGRAVVVANGCEGEPLSFKDRLLLERLPHLVIDGALLVAHAAEASEVIFAVDEHATRAARATGRALRERPEPAQRGAPSARLATLPSGYVSGQESAVVNFLGGGPAKPTGGLAPIFERGVRGRPTLMSNVETLAHIALIARHGAGWFGTLGAYEEPGSTLVTLGGAVAHPGVFEIEIGASVASLVHAAGGATGELRAFLLGGYAGTWVPADWGRELPLSPGQLDEVGAALGAGIVFAFPASACAVAEVASVTRWLSAQSAGQCGPCVYGLDAIATALEQVRVGAGGEGTLARIHRWAGMARGRGACGHPDGVVRFVISATEVFAEELADHARHGECAGCLQRPLLPTPVARPEHRAA
jgi:NADH:ubiquinone oxidoreductase subunit F (NADH-binding)